MGVELLNLTALIKHLDDVSYLTCSNVSWNEDNVLLAPELNPRVAFDRMFRDFNSPEARRKAVKQRSVLDAVLDRSKTFSRDLSSYDKHKMDQYFSSIRELEERLDKIITPPAATPGAWKPSLTADKTAKFRPPEEVPNNAEEYMDALIDIMILGMWSDSTRVCTLMPVAHFEKPTTGDFRAQGQVPIIFAS